MSGNRKKVRMMSVCVCSVVSSKARYCYYKKPKGKLSNSWMFVAELGMISTKMPAPMYIMVLFYWTFQNI